jgi:hypothetical protein
MRKDDVFPSKYLKASDLPEPCVATIAGATMELFQHNDRDQDKLVVGFKERIKAVICNMTRFDAIAAVAGTDETAKWRGVKVELFADEVRFRGKVVGTVGVREPDQGQLQTNGGGEPPRRPQAATRPQPVSQPRPIHDDLNDEIPWTD